MASPKDHKHKASHKSGASFGSNRQFEEDRKLRSAGEKPEPKQIGPPASTQRIAEAVTAAPTLEPVSAPSASSGSTSSVEGEGSPATPEATALSAVPVAGAETPTTAQAVEAFGHVFGFGDGDVDEHDDALRPDDVDKLGEVWLRSPDYPGRVVSEVVSRRGWNKPRDVVELLERQARASHGAVADVQLMKDVAEWLRLESGLDSADDET